MKVRHRIPTIFNLSMVDVLCCALGCVILLWLINFREAKRRSAAAGESSKQLAITRGDLDRTLKELAALRQKNDATVAALGRTQSRLSTTTQDLESAKQRHADSLAA